MGDDANKIIDWLLCFFAKKKNLNKFTNTELISNNYVQAGFIDSLGIVLLVQEIEKKFKIKFNPRDYQDRQFLTIFGLANIIKSHVSDANDSRGVVVYNKSDIINSIKACGIVGGDLLFIHSNLGFFSYPEGITNESDMCRLFMEALFDVIGSSGTIVVPTFTYSFSNNNTKKVFDVQNTPSKMGAFSEFVRLSPQSCRSEDPMFSVSAIGELSSYLTKKGSLECFGVDSFWDKFYKKSGKICNFNLDSGSTFIHYVEKNIGVSYRKDRFFNGELIIEGVIHNNIEIVYFCRDINQPDSQTNFENFDRLAKERGVVKTSPLGSGEIVSISARDTFDIIREEIEQDPFFLRKKG